LAGNILKFTWVMVSTRLSKGKNASKPRKSASPPQTLRSMSTRSKEKRNDATPVKEEMQADSNEDEDSSPVLALLSSYAEKTRTNVSPNASPSFHAFHAEAKEWLNDTQQKMTLAFTSLDKKAEDLLKSHLTELQDQIDFQNHVVDLAERMGFHFDLFSWSYISRLAFSIAFFAVTAYINALASVCAAYRKILLHHLTYCSYLHIYHAIFTHIILVVSKHSCRNSLDQC
jgi:hypothetical protein